RPIVAGDWGEIESARLCGEIRLGLMRSSWSSVAINGVVEASTPTLNGLVGPPLFFGSLMRLIGIGLLVLKDFTNSEVPSLEASSTTMTSFGEAVCKNTDSRAALM